jgi:glycosyltransferase involved in cell wall biosynthesis
VVVRVVLDVSAVPPRPAGAGRYIIEVARRVPNDVTDLTIVTRRGDAARWSSITPRAEIAPLVPDARPRRLLFERLALGRSTPARHADVWHSPHYTMPRGCRAPVVVTVHDTTYFTHPEWHERAKVELFTRAIRFATLHADAVIAVSERTAHELSELAPGPAPVVVAPHGVDLARFRPDGAVLPADAAYIAFVGTREPRKGIDVLLAAFDRLADDDGTLELRLVGQPGWGTAPLARQVAALRHGDRVRECGFVSDDDLPVFLRGARAVAYPSRGEGFGLPVLEAMACGIPTVTTADTVMADVGGDTVFLATAGDDHSLAEALARALALDDTARAELAGRSCARAGLFTWDRSIDAHRRAYDVARAHPEGSGAHS